MSRRSLTGLVGAAAAAALLVGPAVAFRAADRTSAATDPRAGVVIITTHVGYQPGAVGAGTGIVLSGNEVVTNNHVIRGASTIHVTDVSSHRSYTATVAGYSVSRDVAVLRLQGSPGLKTAPIGDSAAVRLGDRVLAVGNAGGTGVLTTSRGKLIGLHRSITVGEDEGDSSRMTGLLVTSARLVPGDSGGPLLSRGRVVGVDAATSTGFLMQDGGEGFAIPINTALAVARQIETGHGSATVHVGPTAFLGVALGGSGNTGSVPGALVQDVVPNSPADRAGVGPGDLITRFAGRRISSTTALRQQVLRLAPGRTVRVTWLDRFGAASAASVRLASGPPQ